MIATLREFSHFVPRAFLYVNAPNGPGPSKSGSVIMCLVNAKRIIFYDSIRSLI